MYSSWHPPVGVFIAILALLGALVPLFREKIGRREKALWTLVMFALVLLEIRSTYLERDEHDREQARVREEELIRFEKIAVSIDNSIVNSQKQFDATMARTDKIINLERSTLGGVKRSLDTITGGDSFCYAVVKGNNFNFIHKGLYPLYAIKATVIGIEEDRRVRMNKDVSFEKVYSSGDSIVIGDLGLNIITVRPIPESLLKSNSNDSNIYYIARNMGWLQMLRRRNVNDKWLTATQVFRFTPPRGDLKKIFESVDPGYPKDNNGKVNWD